MCSFKGVLIGGVVLAVLDLLFGVFILGFYGAIQHDKYNCPWAHGIRSCDYFIHDTNHSTRTIIGIVEGIVSIFFSVILLFSFIKHLPYLAWTWLVKALIVIGMNSYFVGDWLVKRGRYFHTYWNPNEYNEESWFIMGGSVEIVVQLVLSFVFCCLSASFTYKLHRRRRAEWAAETDI